MVYRPSEGSKSGYSTTSLMPKFEGRENCIFQIRIPRRFLYEKERAEVFNRRCLWGTDIYTDDSDIIAVLMHLGKIPPVLPEGVDISMVTSAPITNAPNKAADEVPPAPVGRKGRAVKGKAAAANGAAAAAAASAAANEKQNGATAPPNNCLNLKKDVVVNILILPALEKYSSSVRCALKSRAWLKQQHDGMSFMVHEVKNVEAGEAEGRGKSMRKQRLNEREYIRKWGTLPGREGEGGMKTVPRGCWEAKVGA